MKKSFTFLYLLSSTYFLLIASCKPCNSCNDENLVKVNVSDATYSTYQWEMSQAVQHSNGTATSSINIVPTGTTIVNSSAADSVTTSVYLTATDNESGIKCLRLSGGFGFTCENNANQAIVLDGILAQKTLCLDLTNCCIKSQRIAYENLSQFITCPIGRTFTNGGVGITAIIENCAGKIDTTFLTVQF